MRRRRLPCRDVGRVRVVGGEEEENQQPGRVGRKDKEQDMERSEAMKEALEIVKAQASVRTMSAEEIMTMVTSVAGSIMALGNDSGTPGCDLTEAPFVDAKKSIRETSVTCLECGKRFKVITRKHLAHHGLTPAEYRAKYGLKKGTALTCKSLARERRKKMGEMKLWEKRRKPETPVQQ